MEGEEEIESHCGSLINDLMEFPSIQYPFLVSQLENEDDEIEEAGQILSTISPDHSQNQLLHYHCRISGLHGRKIEGCFHGWLLLSKLIRSTPVLRVIELCLWNPATPEFIHLPVLELELEGQLDMYYLDEIRVSYLSSPPYEPDSVLMLTRLSKETIVFYALNSKRKQWSELSYVNEIRKLTNGDDAIILSLFGCNGNTYASTIQKHFVQVDMDMLVEHGVISFLPLGMLPSCQLHSSISCLAGNHKELYTILLCCMNDAAMHMDDAAMHSVNLFKLDFPTMTWEELKNAKDNRVLFLRTNICSQISCVATDELECGTCIHIIWFDGEVYTYKMVDKTFSRSSLTCPDLPLGNRQGYTTTWIMPENWSVVDHGETNPRRGGDEEEAIGVGSVILEGSMTKQFGEETTEQGPLFQLPLHILESIAECCVFTAYLNFCTTCKLFRLAVQRCSSTVLARLQKSSPLLMVMDEDQEIATFIDPKFGHKYFTTTIPILIGHVAIYASNYGWLLIFGSSFQCLVLCNPFTKVTIQFPQLPQPVTRFATFAFSRPPTSPLCVVAAFLAPSNESFLITSPGESEWREVNITSDIPRILSPYNSRVFYANNIYILCRNEELGIIRFDQDYRLEILVDEFPRQATYGMQRFLVECGNNLLLLIVGTFGKFVEVFKLNHVERQWERVFDIGEHMMYVWNKSCLSAAAKISGMENKIYFPRSRNGKLVFYSLNTCKFHTFGSNGEEKEEAFIDFFSTKENYSTGVWVEPNWSS